MFAQFITNHTIIIFPGSANNLNDTNLIISYLVCVRSMNSENYTRFSFFLKSAGIITHVRAHWNLAVVLELSAMNWYFTLTCFDRSLYTGWCAVEMHLSSSSSMDIFIIFLSYILSKGLLNTFSSLWNHNNSILHIDKATNSTSIKLCRAINFLFGRQLTKPLANLKKSR